MIAREAAALILSEAGRITTAGLADSAIGYVTYQLAAAGRLCAALDDSGRDSASQVPDCIAISVEALNGFAARYGCGRAAAAHDLHRAAKSLMQSVQVH